MQSHHRLVGKQWIFGAVVVEVVCVSGLGEEVEETFCWEFCRRCRLRRKARLFVRTVVASAVGALRMASCV